MSYRITLIYHAKKSCIKLFIPTKLTFNSHGMLHYFKPTQPILHLMLFSIYIIFHLKIQYCQWHEKRKDNHAE
ncbi:hypothetical protein EUGRSUZ_K02003 [Eucalyptus grandis]|uniref:Uncharacterized protein n=2 Tax=Eucalyptus grandis TaxID=71139 RepID=A0A059A4J4_EUCGR|nr:hypothetical protein EUGRSUZ_K02003 [Eucalyptus grandis]